MRSYFAILFRPKFVHLLVSIAALSLITYLGFRIFHAQPSSAASSSLTSRTDWENGELIGVESDTRAGDLQLQANGTWGPRNLATPPENVTTGSAMLSVGDYIYHLVGNGRPGFWRYSPVNDRWFQLANAPSGAYSGSDMTFIGSSIYAVFGGNQEKFAKYSIDTNSWTTITNLPGLANSGSTIMSDGSTYVYALRGNSSQDFYRYDPNANTWTIISGPPATIGNAANLVYASGALYTPRGLNTTTFYKYDISGNAWTSLAVTPVALNDENAITTNGSDIYVARANTTTTFYKYTIGSNTWSTLTDAPATVRLAGGPIYHPNDGYIYFFRGNGTRHFWKYNINTNAFVGPLESPQTFGIGSDLVYNGGNLYNPRGLNTTTFQRYSISGNTWATMTAAPAAFNDDTKGVSAGSYLYFFRASNTTDFYRYDIGGNSWSSMTVAPSTVRFGGSLAYTGSGDYIYATRGNNTLSFWRYSILGNSWDDVSVADLPADTESNIGSRLISDGTNIYYIPGVGIKRFYKYTIGSNTWTEMAALPFTPYYGTDIAYANGKFVALAGYYERDVWEYSISDNAWRRLPSISGYQAQEYGPYQGASIEYDGIGSFYVTRGNSLADITSYTPGSFNYPTSGTWVSEVQDLAYVSSWTNLSITATTPGNSSVTAETRSSANNTSWTNWQAVSGGTISSLAQRYLQVRLVLNATSDQSQTPIVNDVTFTYSGDTTAPTNPSAVSGYSQEISGVALVSGTQYTYPQPYFTWSGASDAGTGIRGYYVYFGTNNSADPVVSGSFQTDVNYVVTTPMSVGSYYLRVKTQDIGENVSAATTLFTYNYQGISPPTSVTFTNDADFSGTTSNTTVGNNQITLASKAGFWREARLSTTPAGMQYGAKSMAYVSTSNKIYVFQGAASTTFYSYDLATDVWSALAVAPAAVRFGGGVIEGPSGYLYGLPGNGLSSFWRYTIGTNTWDDAAAADMPNTVSTDGSIIYDGSRYIYVMRGNSDDAFWRYDTQSDLWESMADADFGAPSSSSSNLVGAGGDLVFNGSDTIYAIQGGTTPSFSEYSIGTNSWTVLTDLPLLATYGSAIEYDAATNAIYLTANDSGEFYKYSIDTQTWSRLQNSPAGFSYGATLRNISGSIYGIRGGATTSFYRYDLTKNSWLVPTRNLFSKQYIGASFETIGSGADITRDGNGYLYLTRGSFGDDFIRYDPQTGETVALSRLPIGATIGSSIEYVSTSNQIYYLPGQMVQKLYTYSITSDTWSEVTTDPPLANTDTGSSMTYDGSQYLYMAPGNNATTFYRYDTQASAGTRWAARASAPAGLGNGAELIYRGGYVYSVRGNNVANNPFYRYDTNANTWSDPAAADLTFTVSADGFLVDGNDGYLYAARGNNTSDWYRYSINSNTWGALAAAPANITTGGAGFGDGVNRVYGFSGNGTNSYNDALYTYIQQTNTSSFQESGSYTSQVHDVGSIFAWTNLVLNYQSQTNTAFTVQTRTSSDNASWSSWTDATKQKIIGTSYSYKISSPAQRYIQIQFTLTSGDGVLSGAITDYTINYYQDNTAPSNPTDAGFSAYRTSAASTSIATATWYPESAPYFTWAEADATNGATDPNGSGVAGYYVYFGTNSSATPETAGTFQTTANYTASGLVSNQTYYLRISTKDNAGNVSGAVWQPFIYQFDNTTPDVPANIAASPSGFSATNTFSFTWSAVSVGSGAPFSSYCYKTGATSGSLSVDQCITATSISGISAYQTGTNTFYVRSKDSAENYSAYGTVSYYYNATAPSPPTNIAVSPSSNTQNNFAFSWDPPSTYVGSLAKLTYFYSVNTLPTAQSVQQATGTSLVAGPYATVPGQNYLYVVAKDEAGNIDYNLHASIAFTADTSAPGVPLNLDIADISVKQTKSWKLALSWEAPTQATSGVDTYQVYRSYDGVTYSFRAASGGISYVDTELAQREHWYKVRACDSTNNCGVFSDVVKLYPDGKYTSAADLTSGPDVSNVSTKRALINWSTNRTSDSKVAYGTKPGEYLPVEVANSDHKTEHSLGLTSLAAGTTYFYVVKWTDEDGNTGISPERTFTTNPSPSISSVTESSISISSALITFRVRGAAKAELLYGKSTGYGGLSETFTSNEESTYTVQLSNLEDGTQYHYQLRLHDNEKDTYEFEDHTFNTLPRPRLENIKVQQVKGTAQPTMLISWKTNTEVSSIISYYPTSDPTQSKDEIDTKLLTGDHKIVLRGLYTLTNYTMTVRGRDRVGNEGIAAPVQFTTASDTRPPEITNLLVEGSIAPNKGNADVTAQLVVSWNSDEPTSSQVEYAEGTGTTYSQRTQEDSNLTVNHVVVISGLSPSKVYHFRAIGKDSAGNPGVSIDNVSITPKATDSALDLVISNLSEVFGFLKQL